ncbi:MAG: prepilin-type N-terminal cleavage/methylation domain-containing protein [SAR202 cluster bacterium]|nr:prepilin-type N-terminal cleavage/methylation domain-containing protein [SAR202 cluster bacterium]
MLHFTLTRSYSLAPASRRRYGFTLIELLVLVSIIALLVAILLPALSLAKHLAYEARCAHNLHQVNIGFVIYADQYDGRYPLEDTEHNPHPDLITILAADCAGPAILMIAKIII